MAAELASADGGRTLSLTYRSPAEWPTALACAGNSDCLAVFTDNDGRPTRLLAGGATRSWHALPTTDLAGSFTDGLLWLVCPTAGHCLATGAFSLVAVTRRTAANAGGLLRSRLPRRDTTPSTQDRLPVLVRHMPAPRPGFDDWAGSTVRVARADKLVVTVRWSPDL